MILNCVTQSGEVLKIRTSVLTLIPLMQKLQQGGIHSFSVAVEASSNVCSLRTLQLAVAANHYAIALNAKAYTNPLYMSKRNIKLSHFYPEVVERASKIDEVLKECRQAILLNVHDFVSYGGNC